MARQYSFRDVSRETALGLLKGRLLPREYTRFQLGCCDGDIECVICWEADMPHVVFKDTTPARVKLEGTSEFVRQHPHAVLRVLADARRLFDHVCKHTNLKFKHKSLDPFGRGVEYLYGV